MDPFSLTVGALTLAETANKLASSLTDRYRAFSSAPREMLEIAGQVTMCAGLVDVFARSVERSGEGFPKRFQQDASTLVKQCRIILKDIDDMIPHGSKKPDYGDRLKYAFGSQKKIAKHQDNLKQVQHMFMFMTTCWQYQLPSRKPAATAAAPSSSSSTIPMGSLQGVLQHMPVQINMKTPGNASQTITYEATLTLKPVEQRPIGGIVGAAPVESGSRIDGAAPGSGRRRKSHISSRERESSDRQKQTLENMRRSPYFSMKLLKPEVVELNKKRRNPVSYSRMPYEEAEKAYEAAYSGDEYEIEKAKRELEAYKAAHMRDEYEVEIARRELEAYRAAHSRDEYEAEKARREYEEKMMREAAQKKASDPNMERREYEERMRMEFEDRRKFDERPPMAINPITETAQKAQKGSKGKSEGRMKPPSKEEASEEVDNILSQWFDEDPEPESDDDGYDSFSEHEEDTVVEPEDQPPLTRGELDYENPFRPRSVPIPEHQKWDWICDGCDRAFYFHDRRFKCRDCSNFDFCRDCYGVVGHRHGSLSFVERSF